MTFRRARADDADRLRSFTRAGRPRRTCEVEVEQLTVIGLVHNENARALRVLERNGFVVSRRGHLHEVALDVRDLRGDGAVDPASPPCGVNTEA